MQVVNFNKSVYTLLNLVTGKHRDYHVTQLKKFDYDLMNTSPSDIATKEAQEFHVEEILQHSGNRKVRSSMEFLVKWTGYDETYNSWEPWENLRDTQQLQQYLYDNRMKSLMNKNIARQGEEQI